MCLQSASPDQPARRAVVSYREEELAEACKAVVLANDLSSCYIRPMVLRGYGATGMDGGAIHGDFSPIETYVPVFAWGSYLGEEGARFISALKVFLDALQRFFSSTFCAFVRFSR